MLSYPSDLTQGPRLVTLHWLYRTSRNFVVKRSQKKVRMTSVVFKMADVNARYLRSLKRWHQKDSRKRIQHAFVDRIDKSVHRVTVFHLDRAS